MDRQTLSRLRYPFPSLINPHARAMQDHTDRHWIDGDYQGLVPPGIADGFKKAGTAYMASCFFPSATWERLTPAARMMLFVVCQDDLYEHAEPAEVRRVGRATVEVAHGHKSANEAGVLLGGMIETLRKEMLEFVPPETVARWAGNLDDYFEGLERETGYLRSGETPTVAEYREIREKAMMIHAILDLTEVETGVVLPAEIHRHPVLRRLSGITVRVVSYFNEFQSYEKDMSSGTGNMNFINVIANEEGTGIDEARERLFAIHAGEVEEFRRLHLGLPDFGDSQDAVDNHVHHMSFIMSGWRKADSMIDRYQEHFYLKNQQQLAVSAARSTRVARADTQK